VKSKPARKKQEVPPGGRPRIEQSKRYTPRFPSERAWELMGLLLDGKRLTVELREEIAEALNALVIHQAIERMYWERTGLYFRLKADPAAVKLHFAALSARQGNATRAAILEQAQQLLQIAPRDYRDAAGQIKRAELAERISALKNGRGYGRSNVLRMLGKLIAEDKLK
jgi:hypothetical protein